MLRGGLRVGVLWKVVQLLDELVAHVVESREMTLTLGALLDMRRDLIERVARNIPDGKRGQFDARRTR